MDLQSRITVHCRWRDQVKQSDGAVTIEAAFAVAALLVVFSLLAQGGTTLVVYLRALSVATESAQIAAASGPLSKLSDEARLWAEKQIPNALVEVTTDGIEVEVRVAVRANLFGDRLQPMVVARSKAVRIDAAAWS